MIIRPPDPLVAGWLRSSKPGSSKTSASAAAQRSRGAGVGLRDGDSSGTPWRSTTMAALHAGHHFIAAGGARGTCIRRDARLAPDRSSRVRRRPSFGRSSSSCRSASRPNRLAHRRRRPRARASRRWAGRADRAVERGVWNWLDPVTAVAATGAGRRAVPTSAARCSCSRGAATAREHRQARDARDLAQRLRSARPFVSSTRKRSPTPSAPRG